MIVLCKNCNSTFDTSKIGFISNPVEGLEDVEDIGLECPKCKTWFHSYYLSKELKKLQTGIRNRHERRAYEHKFKKFQKMMGRKVAV